jgi:hypothetical protein
VKSLLTIAVLLLSLPLSLAAQHDPNDSISVAFSIDGKLTDCADFQVELRLNGKKITPKHTAQFFLVPAIFKKPAKEWQESERVDISIACNGHSFVFSNQSPAFVESGSSWQLGMANPLYALKTYGYTHEFDRGAWLGYLIFEGEPGVVTFVSEPDPPTGRIGDLLAEQPSAKGEHARNIARIGHPPGRISKKPRLSNVSIGPMCFAVE